MPPALAAGRSFLASVRLSSTPQVKKEIETSFEQQAVYLRQRGVQLCRQVEVLASHQESRFQLDLAKLHQFMGSMRSLLQLHASGRLTDADPTKLAYQISM